MCGCRHFLLYFIYQIHKHETELISSDGRFIRFCEKNKWYCVVLTFGSHFISVRELRSCRNERTDPPLSLITCLSERPAKTGGSKFTRKPTTNTVCLGWLRRKISCFSSLDEIYGERKTYLGDDSRNPIPSIYLGQKKKIFLLRKRPWDGNAGHGLGRRRFGGKFDWTEQGKAHGSHPPRTPRGFMSSTNVRKEVTRTTRHWNLIQAHQTTAATLEEYKIQKRPGVFPLEKCKSILYRTTYWLRVLIN